MVTTRSLHKVLPNVKQVFLKVRQDEKGGTNVSHSNFVTSFLILTSQMSSLPFSVIKLKR